jgi:hypothetical protein
LEPGGADSDEHGCGRLAVRCNGDDYEGEPVPFGFVRFEPDASKGNTGPGAGAQVKNGEFSTAKGKGIVGGPHQIIVYATDGIHTKIDGEDAPQGRPLFSDYKTQVDFPKDDVEWNVDVPKTGQSKTIDAR